jgi:hypothetical protein
VSDAATPTASAPGSAHRVLQWVRALSAAAIAFATLVRLVSTHARFPWWELDPSRQPIPESALLPSQGFTLDLIVWIASLLGVAACILLREPLRWVTGLLAAFGSTGALFAFILMPARAGSGPDDASLGSAWAAAVIGAWALTHLARDRAIRAGLIAVLAGAACALAAKGAYQVFIEHPATIAHYKANADAMLAAQALEPGSSGAKEFERRLMQPEATAWVGMSNANASILAATLALLLGFAVAAWRSVKETNLPTGIAGVLSLATLAAAAGLAMTFSKGGIVTGALAVSLTLGVAVLFRDRTPSVSERADEQNRSPSRLLRDGFETRHPSGPTGRRAVATGEASPQRGRAQPVVSGLESPSPRRGEGTPATNSTEKDLSNVDSTSPQPTPFPLFSLSLSLPLLALLAVLIRGLLGERLHELSLLFRSQYLLGASRVIAHSFPWGVGPGGFKPAYALYKPPLSPESIESPHSILFDWTATLGIFGVAWCALLFIWLYQAGRTASQADPTTISKPNPTAPAPNQHNTQNAQKFWPWLIIPLAACLVAWSRESPTIAPDEWPIRVFAVIAWLATITCALRIPTTAITTRWTTASFFAAAVALATHAQIELTPILPATASFVFLLIALATTSPHDPTATPSEPRAQARGQNQPGIAPHRSSPYKEKDQLRILLLTPLVCLVFRTFDLGDCAAAWESHLRSAAETVAPIAALRPLIANFGNDPNAATAVATELSRLFPGRTINPDAASIARAYADATDAITDSAWASLLAARSAYGMPINRPLRPLEAAIRLRLGVAIDCAAMGQAEAAKRHVDATAKLIEQVESDRLASRPAEAFAPTTASAYQAIHSIDPDPKWLSLAADRWRTVITQDPQALTPVLRLIDILEQLGGEQAGAEMPPLARRALELNENLRLDPLKQLSPAQRTRLEALTTPTPPQSPRP